jgi:sugar/nucleoside kinase (ribokinase family)
MRPVEVIAIGTCYVDTNLPNYPFASTGIPAEVELVGGHYETVAGGSAVNFCRFLGNFGLRTAFIGMAGKDTNGDSLERALELSGVTSSLVRNETVLTNISFNMTNTEGEHIMLVAGTANAALNGETVLPKLQETLDGTKMVYLGGCFKLKNLAPAFDEIATITQKHGKSLVVDHGRIPQDLSDDMNKAVKQLVRGSRYYLPSRDEFCSLWGVGSIEEGIQYLHSEAPSLTVIVKDGANGAWYYEDGRVHHAPARPVERVVDATGAGDSFNAGFMTAINEGISLSGAVVYACRVGAAKVSGQVMPSL